MGSLDQVREDAGSAGARLYRECGELTDEEAMARLRDEGDRKAFAGIVRRWRSRILGLCVRMLGDPDRAEDVTQDVFARLLARPDSFGHASRFSTFLWRVAVNACLDERRRLARRAGAGRRPQASVAAADSAASPLMHAVREERAGLVRAALDELPDHYRAVVVLRHYEGLKFREVAEVLDIPQGTVKSRMAEALDRLAEILQPLGENSTKRKERRP
jgi:RNA polymerase sigma-70 factor (ECF subfamily)